MNRRAVLSILAVVAVVVTLLSVAQQFVLIARALPVQSLPKYPSDDESLNALNNYQRDLVAFAPYQSDLITAWGLSIFAALVAVWRAGHYGPNGLRKVLKGSVLVVSSVCFAFYLDLAGATSGVLQVGFPFSGDLVAWLRPTMEWGYLAFVAFCISVGGLALGIRSLGKSWPASVRGALAMFGVPGVLFLEVGLLLNSPSNMFAYVITHAQNKLPDGSYLLSNWNVLFAALAIAVPVYGSFVITRPRLEKFLKVRPVRAALVVCSLTTLAMVELAFLADMFLAQAVTGANPANGKFYLTVWTLMGVGSWAGLNLRVLECVSASAVALLLALAPRGRWKAAFGTILVVSAAVMALPTEILLMDLSEWNTSISSVAQALPVVSSFTNADLFYSSALAIGVAAVALQISASSRRTKIGFLAVALAFSVAFIAAMPYFYVIPVPAHHIAPPVIQGVNRLHNMTGA